MVGTGEDDVEPISGDEIRLLRFVTPFHHKETRLELKCYSRSQAPQYLALSYAWGDELPSYTVTINHCRTLIRTSLWQFFQHLAHDGSTDYYWIDALCINQQDIDERNAQVGRMGETYFQARRVKVWLGPATQYTSALFDADAAHFETVGLDPTNAECEAVKDIASRPYWSRMWIVQELLLAQSVEVLCGEHVLTWERFSTALMSVLEMAPNRVDWNELRHHPIVRFIGSEGVYHFTRSDRTSLLWLLVDYGKASCTDPKDKVFALLGLLDGAERKLLPDNFPDYRLTLGEVICIALTHALEQDETAPALFHRVLEAFEIDHISDRVLRRTMNRLDVPCDLRSWSEARTTADLVAEQRVLDGTLAMVDIFNILRYQDPVVAVQGYGGSKACRDPRAHQPDLKVEAREEQLFKVLDGRPHSHRYFTTNLDPDQASAILGAQSPAVFMTPPSPYDDPAPRTKISQGPFWLRSMM